MQIRFGRALDGEHSWQPVDGIGRTTLGPNGLLELLELHLGLPAHRQGRPKRVIHYRKHLARLDDGSRFYSRSIRVDDLGVAAMLLEWRDALFLHGWNGSFMLQGAPQRLKDLQAVESSMRDDPLPPCEGERLAIVAAALRSLVSPVTRLELTEPLEEHPLRWQEVIRLLPFTPGHDAMRQPRAPEKTALGRLQRYLLTGEQPPFEPEWDTDRSIVICTADTALAAACHAVGLPGGYCRGSVILVNGGEGHLFDDVSESMGLPRSGLHEKSAGRPALQLLPLVIRLRWTPLDVQALLSLLTLPDGVNPVDAGLRHRIARAVAQSPGIGGIRWQKAIEDFRKTEGADAEEHLRNLLFWVEDRTATRQTGIAVEELIRYGGMVRQFYNPRMAASEEGMKQAVAAGFSQADEFLSALHSLLEQGITRLRRYQIDQLLSYSTARGSHHPGLVRQAGSVRTANDPASVIEPYDTVLWWRAEAPGLAGSQVWSSRERAWLQKQGVKVPDQEEELARQAQSWHRPVLAAVQRLIFMLPPEDVEKHPLWLTISALFPGIPVQHIERQLGEAGCSPQNAVAHRDLPLCKPRLQLERGVPMPDRPFSATSLERFIYNPYEWVLAYAARLSPSRVLEVSAGQRLYGILAHRMVQQLVLDLREGLLDAGRFEAWYEREFPRLVDAEGATLLMPGKGSELEGVRIRIRQAIAGLLPFLQKQGASRMETEYELKGTFPGGSLHGFADLLLFDREGRPSLIDMKWGGAESYRKSLAEGTHLQLIIYAGLVRQQTGKWPAIAYYMLGRAQLIAQRDDLFEGASVVRNSSGQSTAELWDRFLVSFAWRLDQLRQGSIEVAPETADELMPVPEEGLKPVLLNKEYNPYRTLEGWERGT